MVSQSRKTVQHREERSEIAIDETKIKLRKKWHYLWAAIDIHTREILAVHLTASRSALDALLFLKKALKFYTNKPKSVCGRRTVVYLGLAETWLTQSTYHIR